MVNDEAIIKLSQQKNADILGFAKTKVNNVIRDLKQNGYLTQLSSRGKYALTDAANVEIKKCKVRRLEDEHKYIAIRSGNQSAH